MDDLSSDAPTEQVMNDLRWDTTTEEIWNKTQCTCGRLNETDHRLSCAKWVEVLDN